MRTKANVLIKVLIAIIISICMTYLGVYALPNKNLGINIFGIVVIIGLILMFIIVEKKNKSPKNDIIRFGVFLAVIAGILLLNSFALGGVAVIVYNIAKSYHPIDFIKKIIDMYTGIFAILLIPLLLMTFFEMKWIKKEKLYSKSSISLYIKHFILVIIVFGLTVLFSKVADTTFKMIVYSFLGFLQIIISYILCNRIRINNRTHRVMKTVTSIVLCFSLVISSLNVVFANQNYYEAQNENDILLKRPIEQTEMNKPVYTKDPTLRQPKKYYDDDYTPDGTLVAVDKNSATYQIGANTYLTEIGGNDFSYINSEGKIKTIDNTLIPKVKGFSRISFENRNNDYKISLPEAIDKNNGIKITKDDYIIELMPFEGDFSKSVVVDNAILYNDVFDGIDYQYTVIGDVVKEDIVLNKFVDKNEFYFRLLTNDMLVNEVNNEILICDKNTNEVVYTIIAPEMNDASGEVSLEVDLSLEIIEGESVVKITADKEWLNSPERAYPVRIDPTINISSDCIGLYGMEEYHADIVIGDNNYPYCGYDDGIVSRNQAIFGKALMRTRTYVDIDYDFTQISKEAKIESATLELYHYTDYSKGNSVFNLYKVNESWDGAALTWNKQLNMSHSFVDSQNTNVGEGWMRWDITDVINSWVMGTANNYGFAIKAENESTMQCEVFHNKNGTYKPQITIVWSIPDPVDSNYGIDNTTINLRPITETNVQGKLKFDSVFADGVAMPKATVIYTLMPGGTKSTTASESYKYPDSTAFETQFPNGTKYKSKLSNWQSGLFGSLSFDSIYYINASAIKDGITGKTVSSDKFLIYKVKQLDTLPAIANHYGVDLKTIMKDNSVQDTLLIENNTIFIRNPKTATAYNTTEHTYNEKEAIDSALLGRGLHCEYGFEPININTGNFYFDATDASIEEINKSFDIQRTYNSKGNGNNSVFGLNWNFEYDERLGLLENGTIVYHTGDGKILYFTLENGKYISPEGYQFTFNKSLYQSGNNSYYVYKIYENDGSYKEFNAWGLLTKIVDKDGLTTTLQYDDNYNIKSITSPFNKTYSFVCDGNGRIVKITLPNSAILQYKYDYLGNLTEHIDANGNSIRYVYDANGYMTEWYDQEGIRIVKNTYDSEGRVTTQLDANGNKITLQYGANQTITSDANGNVTKYYYDSYYRTTKIEYEDGKIITKAYDENNNLIKDGDITYTYDNLGNITTETRKDGKIKSYQYTNNRLTSVVDFDGKITFYNYSEAGDLIKITYSDNSHETYTYDNYHRIASHTNSNGNTEYYFYDNAVIKEYVDFNGNTYKFYYNSMNQLITTVKPDGTAIRKMYNSAGIQIGEQYEDNSYVEYSLDKTGNVIRTTDGMGYATDIEYDGMDNIISVSNPLGNIVAYAYDKNSNNISVTDELGNITQYQYDCHNRLIKTIYPNEKTIVYEYDTDNNIIKSISSEGQNITNEYDVNNNLILTKDEYGSTTEYIYNTQNQPIKIIFDDGTYVLNSYDDKKLLIEQTDTTGKATKYTYDAVGNLIATTENDARTTQYFYDKNSNLIKIITPNGEVTTYEYNSINQKITETDALGYITRYEYDLRGNLVKTTNALGNEATTEYDYNGNVVAVTDYNGNRTIYVYDACNNLISQKVSDGGITNYIYDDKGQLIIIVNPLNYETTYCYDALGNVILTKDALGNEYITSYDKNNNIAEVSLPNGKTVTYEYDLSGRNTKITESNGLEKEYSYDAIDRILTEKDNTGKTIAYTYDEYGRLVEETDNIGRSRTYQYDEFSQILASKEYDNITLKYEYDNNGNVVKITYPNEGVILYSYDAIGRITSYTDVNGGVYEYSYDEIGRLIEETDPISNKKMYSYDENGNLLSETNSNGITISYTYDTLNRLTSKTDGNGNTTVYEYDKLSRLIKTTEANGAITEYFYDACNNLTQIKTPNGYVTEYVYDEVGNVIKEIAANGEEAIYTYDINNNITSKTDALGNRTEYEITVDNLTTKIKNSNGGEYLYEYDEVDRLISITTPMGYIREFSYDEAGNIASETDNMGNLTSYEYDLMNRIISITEGNGSKKEYSYDYSGNIVEEKNAKGAVSKYSYDLINQLVQYEDAEGKVTSWEYDSNGNVAQVCYPEERKIEYAYDNNNNLVKITDPMGYEINQEYDLVGNVVRITDALGYYDSYEYDLSGQVISSTNKAGHVTGYSYDSQGNISSVTNSLNGITKYDYDLCNQLIGVTDPLNNKTSYTYDSMGNMISTTNADGKTTDYEYDLENRLTAVVNPDGTKEIMTYDLIGNIKSLAYPNGDTITYDYDKINNLISKNYNDDSNVSYLYNENGNRISMTDSIGESYYEYDIMDRVTSVTDAYGKTIKYSYDACGRLSAITYSDGRIVQYGYDLNDRLISVNDNGSITNYCYDAVGNLIKTVRPDGSYTECMYNELGNVISLINYQSTNEKTTEFYYTYDERGYITVERSVNCGKEIIRKYEYDAIGQLTYFNEDDGNTILEYIYSYDKSGNRTKLQKTGTDHPETITYSYDKNNRLIETESSIDGVTKYSYDENGNLINKQNSTGNISYEYTVEQRLDAVMDGEELLMAATYDGDGNRLFQSTRYEEVTYITIEKEEEETQETQTEAITESQTENSTESVATQEETSTQETESKTEEGSLDEAEEETQEPTEESTEIPTKDKSDKDVVVYYDKVYKDPGKTIFWYGFGQCLIQTGSFMNSAVGVNLSHEFNEAWDVVTDSYELVPRTETVDIDALPESQRKQYYNSSVLIPEKCDKEVIEVVDVQYELTYYVNNINTELPQVLMEYDEANNVSASYIYGVNRISENNGEVDNYYLYDGRGSVTLVVNKDNIVASYNYDPFGNITNSIEEIGSFYGYNSEDTNPVTKLQYLRARYYDTENGRFMSADNYLGTIDNPLSLNRYIYVQNNPLAYMDPSGHMPVFLIPAIIGAVLGGVGGGVYAGTTSYENQKEQNDGKVNGWIVTRDFFVGSVVGSTVGGASGLAAGGTIAVFGTTSAVTTVVGGAVSAVNAGITYRAANEIVPGVTANLLEEADVKTFAYTETRTAEEIANDAIEAAADPRAMIIDGAVGSLAGISSYGFTQMAKYNKFSKCGNISEKAKMDVVDDVLDKTDDVANMVDDATNNTTTNIQTGYGYDAGDTPVRITGEWSINDMKQGLLGHAPKGLGSPDIHHGGQMPGAAKHEIIAMQHRNNKALHPNIFNQGVTQEMRTTDRKLHWWYRAREQGADELLPDWIYDK